MIIPSEPSPEPLVTLVDYSLNSQDFIVLGAVLLLIVASALFAGAEVAFFSISSTEREQLRKSNARGAKIAEQLLSTPKELLATILIGKNFLNVAFVVLTSYLLTKTMLLVELQMAWIITLSILIVTLILIFIGESYPKTIAFRNKAAYARWMAPYIYVFHSLPPFSWLKVPIAKSSNVLERRAKRKGIKISPDTLETVLTLSQNSGDTREDYTMLRGVLKFGNTDVKQIMCPRMDVLGVDVNSNFSDLMKVFIEGGYSRMPVYRDTFDDVVGIIFVKDLLTYLLEEREFDWKDYIREPFYVPENKKIDELFKDFKSKKVHMAIVLDEYGGSTGIVTMEDVLEEIVGDIADEFDEDEENFKKLNATTYLFEGATSLSDFYKALEIDGAAFEDLNDDAESIGGFIAERAGQIPEIGEVVEVGPYRLIVQDADKKRVLQVKVLVGGNHV